MRDTISKERDNLVTDLFQGDSGGPLMHQDVDGRWLLMGTVWHGTTFIFLK